MSLYIAGLKMPKRMPVKAWIYPDGRVIVTLHSGKKLDCQAQNVPPHGRLIDAGYVMNNMRSEHPYVQNAIRATISVAPTIIPAEDGET